MATETVQSESTGARVWQCTSEEYHQDKAISQSKLKHFLRDPEGFREECVDESAEPMDPTANMQFGIDAERLMFYDELPGHLIPTEVLKEVHVNGQVQHRKDLRHKPYKEFVEQMQAEHGEDVLLLKYDEWFKRAEPLLACREKVRRHDRANKLIFGEGEPQLALKWLDPILERECKCQIDMLHGGLESPRAIVDYKTAQDASPDGFRRAVSNLGYHLQAWWYQRAVEFLTGEVLPVVFVVSKNKPSYHCETYDLSPRWYQLARRDMLDAMAKLRVAFEEDAWTSTTHGRITTLEPNSWDK